MKHKPNIIFVFPSLAAGGAEPTMFYVTQNTHNKCKELFDSCLN